jgi:RNA polymerase sigma-70 factor, ECF subfamily
MDPAERERRLAALWADARATWPNLPDEPARFAAVVSQRHGASLERVHAADLYLAQHCALGSAAALAAVVDGPFGVVRSTVAKLGCSPTLVDEIDQELRASLLVAPVGGGTARIGDYAGRGELRSWLASIAARTARRRLKRDQRHAGGDDLTALAGNDDPELAYFQEAYRDVFADAVAAALATLSTRERNLLRQHHLDGLTLDELATLYAAHRATVARWLAAARQHIVERARQAITQRTELDPDEFDSMLRLVESQVHVSFQRLLAG